jgi:dTDP-glucose 4,6-dehydratase
MSNKTYCILGGGGSFGIHCAMYLLDHAAPAKVVGVGRNPLRPEPFTLGVERRDRYEYRTFHVVHEQDMLLEYLDELRPDVIVNFAAQGEGAASWRHSWRFFDTNATALCRLYEALSNRDWMIYRPEDQSRGRFIHIGTSELYGSVDAPAVETFPIVPTSPYAASKAAFDMYLLAMHKAGRGVPMNILRPSNCYCPGQLLHRIIPRAVVAGLTSQKVPLHGGGAARKSYLHARDLARAIYMVSEADVAGRVFNVGPLSPTSIADVARMCAGALGVKFEDLFDVAPERVGQDGQYWLDNSAIRDAVGWRPEIGWVDGLAEMVEWGRGYLDQLRDWPTGYQLRA